MRLPWLQSTGADPDYILQVQAEVGNCFRYRPEEVAGACLRKKYPVKFVRAILASVALVSAINKYYKRIGLVPPAYEYDVTA